MPIHYERDDARRRILEMSVGTVSLKDLIRVIDRQVADGAWSYTVLNDARAIVNPPTQADLHQLLLHIGAKTCEHGPRGRTAVVVSAHQLKQLVERFARLSEFTALEVRVFGNPADAEAWLNSTQPAGDAETPSYGR